VNLNFKRNIFPKMQIILDLSDNIRSPGGGRVKKEKKHMKTGSW